MRRAVLKAQIYGASAVSASLYAVEGLAPYALLIRYNPPESEGCLCPPFEVHYRDSWHRAILVGPEALLAELEASADPGPLLVHGAPLERAERVAPGGQLFAVVELVPEAIPGE